MQSPTRPPSLMGAHGLLATCCRLRRLPCPPRARMVQLERPLPANSVAMRLRTALSGIPSKQLVGLAPNRGCGPP